MSEILCDWSLLTGPVIEPISVADAKLHTAIVQDDDDALIDAYVMAARHAAESYLGRGLLTQTWQVQVAEWADVIGLPMAAPLQNDPLASPSTAPIVQYYDAGGVLQTLDPTAYLVDTRAEPGRIMRAPGTTWPTVQTDRIDPIVITYVCGWTSPELIPELIRQGIRLHVAASDADRLGGESAQARAAADALWRTAGPVYWRPPQCLR